MSNVEVSIICNAFNHEKYIKDALESFVMQKTTFGYEVLVHDDASTDGTAAIIRQYEEKYPELIKPVYQKENQYSKRVKINNIYQIPRAKGKYIAFCEGDDYWTDPLKLQKQFEAMEKHPEVDMCAHAANRVWADTKKVINTISPAGADTVLSVEDVIRGGGGYVATNSLFYRKELGQCVPEFRNIFSIDYSLQIQGALRGGMLFLSDCMSAYRWMSDGAWTQRVFADKTSRQRHYKRIADMLHQLDEDTDYKYTAVINEHIAHNELNETAFNTNVAENFRVIRKNKKVFSEMPLKKRAKLLIKASIPGITRLRYKRSKG